jgi:hypothetical protein
VGEAIKSFWQDFLTGLAGPAAVAAAEPRPVPARDLVALARQEVQRLITLFAIDSTSGDREIDDALEQAEAQWNRLRRVFDAIAALVTDKQAPEQAGELARLIQRARELALEQTARSPAFEKLVAAIEPASIAPG